MTRAMYFIAGCSPITKLSTLGFRKAKTGS